jgi:hypothetical protein
VFFDDKIIIIVGLILVSVFSRVKPRLGVIGYLRAEAGMGVGGLKIVRAAVRVEAVRLLYDVVNWTTGIGGSSVVFVVSGLLKNLIEKLEQRFF